MDKLQKQQQFYDLLVNQVIKYIHADDLDRIKALFIQYNVNKENLDKKYVRLFIICLLKLQSITSNIWRFFFDKFGLTSEDLLEAAALRDSVDNKAKGLTEAQIDEMFKNGLIGLYC